MCTSVCTGVFRASFFSTGGETAETVQSAFRTRAAVKSNHATRANTAETRQSHGEFGFSFEINFWSLHIQKPDKGREYPESPQLQPLTAGGITNSLIAKIRREAVEPRKLRADKRPGGAREPALCGCQRSWRKLSGLQDQSLRHHTESINTAVAKGPGASIAKTCIRLSYRVPPATASACRLPPLLNDRQGGKLKSAKHLNSKTFLPTPECYPGGGTDSLRQLPMAILSARCVTVSFKIKHSLLQGAP